MYPTQRRLTEGWLLSFVGLMATIGWMSCSPNDRQKPAGPVPDGPGDSPGDAMTKSLAIQITNATGLSARLDGCRHCGPGFELWRVDGPAQQIEWPTVLTCTCDNCDATACQGMVDGPAAWITVPPGASLDHTWDGNQYDLVPGGCNGVGCMGSQPAGAGTYEIRVAYGTSDDPGSWRCPDGTLPWQETPYQGATTFSTCAQLCSSGGCPFLSLAKLATATFDWPTSGTVTVSLE